MNGSDYKMMVENFKADNDLKQRTINAAHSRVFKKLKITKREKFIRYTSVAAMFAMIVVMFFVFNVGEAISIASTSMKGKNSAANSSEKMQLSSEESSENKSQASTQNSTQKATEKTTEKATEKVTVKATEVATEKQTTKVQEVTATAKTTNTTTSKLQILNSSTSYSNVWTTTGNPTSIVQYDFTGSSGSINVNILPVSSIGNMFEAKVGPNEDYTIRSDVHSVLFNNGLVITKSSNGIVTFTNDNEGVILRENIVSYPKLASESQSAYLSRCINYISECCTDASKAKEAFTLSNDYVLNIPSAGSITNSDSEFRVIMKLNYSGNPIASLSKTSYGGFGYLTIVFDKSTQCFLVQTYVVQNSLTFSMSTASYGVKYKVN